MAVLLVLVTISCTGSDQEQAILGSWVSDLSPVVSTTVAGRKYDFRYQTELNLSADGTIHIRSFRYDRDAHLLGLYHVMLGEFDMQGPLMTVTVRRRSLIQMYDPDLEAAPVAEQVYEQIVVRVGDRLRVGLVCPPNANCTGPMYYRRVSYAL